MSEAAKALVPVDDRLPGAAVEPHPGHYQQYLLYCDSQERFTVMSFVWVPSAVSWRCDGSLYRQNILPKVIIQITRMENGEIGCGSADMTVKR